MTPVQQEVDAVIVGAGFAGLYMLHRLRGLGLSARVFEAGDGIGGTWYWNRYPGARCDVESMDYSYSFSDELQQEWRWTERYAAQPEILRYINHVADRFDLRRDIQLKTRVVEAIFDEAASRWEIRTDRGDAVSARFCIMATGCLSEPQLPPPFPGLETFEGRWYHTGRWPHEGVDFTGQRVASSVQGLPRSSRSRSSRVRPTISMSFSAPRITASPLTTDRSIRSTSGGSRRITREFRRAARESRVGFVVKSTDTPALSISPEERDREYEERWQRGGLGFGFSFPDLLVDERANETAAEFFRNKIRSIVRDPAVAERWLPRDYPIGTKRMCVDTNYYDTFNRDNVTLVDLRRTPIETITPKGLRTSEREYAVDAIVFAIGFDAMTGALSRSTFAAAAAQTLRQKWAAGPRTYLGIAVAGFPNLFMITGPGQPVRAQQHDRLDRAACGLDRRLHRLSARSTGRGDRSQPGSRGGLGCACQRGGQRHALSAGRTPGTWGRTSRASRARSCRISAASAPIGKLAMP